MNPCSEGLCVNNYELMKTECICEGDYERSKNIFSDEQDQIDSTDIHI